MFCNGSMKHFFTYPVLRSSSQASAFTDIRRLGIIVFIIHVSSILSVGGSVLRLPEFAEPIKNVTLAAGSDVEFSCDVRYLGSYRFVWSWKKEEEQRILGIGVIKITPNPRVHISRIQKSDDVTQFNLYIYNIRKSDAGTYHCIVNLNPMIEQIGALDVTGESVEYGYSDKQVNGNGLGSTIKSFQSSYNSSMDNEKEASFENQEGDYVNSMPILSTTVDETNSSKTFDVSHQNSTAICIGLNEVWESARERMSSFLSSMMTFTYSYWFS